MSSKQNDQRVEFKYIVNSKNLNRIIDHVSKNNYFFTEQYEDRNINSLYFDSAKLTELNNTLDGLNMKKKFRYRFYDNISEKIEGQWELKEKIGINTTKNIYKEPIYKKQLFGKIVLFTSKFDTVNFYLRKYSFSNRLISYDRKYFVSKKYGNNFRLTLDSNISSSVNINGILRTNTEKDYSILELKISKDIYNKNHLENFLPFSRVGYSKYLEA